MYDSVFFATFDPMFINAPDVCDLCITESPIFNYEYCTEEASGQRQYLKGFCCAGCAEGLLRKLKGREAREWADEEAELEADRVVVADFQKRRMAAFGKT